MRVFLLLITQCILTIAINIDPRKTLVWGSGVDVLRTVTARTVYIQPVDIHGRNITEAGSAKHMNIEVTAHISQNQKQHVQTELLERGDGSLAAMYYFNNPLAGIEVKLKLNSGEHIANSPYKLKGYLREYCNCPVSNQDFRKIYQCKHTSSALLDFDFFDRLHRASNDSSRYIKKTTEEIQQEQSHGLDFDLIPLSPYKAVFRTDDIDEIVSSFNKHEGCFVHYSIRDNEIYAKAYGIYQGFKTFVDDMLFSLRRKVRLPDVEFVMNIGDYPSANATTALQHKPLFSWCKAVDSQNQLVQRNQNSQKTILGRRWSLLDPEKATSEEILSLVGVNGTSDILLPTYKLTRALVWGLNVESPLLTDLKTFKNNGFWENREAKVFFRGRDSNDRRLDFVLKHNGTLDHSDNDWADVRISKNEGNYFPDEESRIRDANCAAQKVVRRKFEFFFRQKFQLNIDGTVAAYRLPALMAGGSAILKQDSIFEEHFYSMLKPNQHYVSVKEDLSDVKEKWYYAMKHDKEMKRIAQEARNFSREWFTIEQMLCDHFNVINAMSNRQKFKPRILSGMNRVTDQREIPHGSQCNCKYHQSLIERNNNKQANKSISSVHDEL